MLHIMTPLEVQQWHDRLEKAVRTTSGKPKTVKSLERELKRRIKNSGEFSNMKLKNEYLYFLAKQIGNMDCWK